MSGTAFRGVSADQDARFGDKEKKLLKALSKTFPPEYGIKVNLSTVNWEAMKPWIAKRLTELLGGVEDDVLIGYVIEQVEGKKTVDPRILQVNLTGFLEKNTSLFCKELWNLLLSAASTPSGIPQKFLDEKAAELREREAERQRMQERITAERSKQEQLRREHIEASALERHRKHNGDRSGRQEGRRSRERSRDTHERRHRSRSRSRNRGRNTKRYPSLYRSRSRSSSWDRRHQNSRRRRSRSASSEDDERRKHYYRRRSPRRDLRRSPDRITSSRLDDGLDKQTGLKSNDELLIEQELREKALQAKTAL